MIPSHALYVHWPFCISKCPYCDFNSHVRSAIDETLWERCLLQELVYTAQTVNKGPLTSVFFGGGTPSLMPPSLVHALLDKAKSLFGFVPDIEITLEANPGTYDESRFKDFAQAGINRLSLGVQSFNDKSLKFLGRIHNSIEAHKALTGAKKLFPRVSFDLIYALPNQSLSSWKAELAQALDYDPSHLSLYQLTFEEGTPFTHRRDTGQLHPMADEEALSLYLETQTIMDAQGLPRYEISNHAKPGFESAHNLTYWNYGVYSGIGPGAHGRCLIQDQKMATRCLKNPEKWTLQVLDRGHGWEDSQPIESLTRFEEAIMMGLRLSKGIPWSQMAALSETLTTALRNSTHFTTLMTEGFLNSEEDYFWLTPKGLLTQSACVSYLLNDLT